MSEFFTSSKLCKPTAPVPHTFPPVTVVCLLLFVFQLQLFLSFCFARPQSWFPMRPSACFSTSTARRWPSASVPPRGAGEGGCRRWSVLSSSPDPQLIIASRTKSPLLYFPVCSLCVCFLRPSNKASLWALSEFIRTPDGGQISLDWVDNQDSVPYPESSTRPTLLILPGLTGNSKQSYVRHATRQATRRGYRSASSRPASRSRWSVLICTQSVTSCVLLCQVCCLQQQRRCRGRAVGKMTCVRVSASTECYLIAYLDIFRS